MGALSPRELFVIPCAGAETGPPLRMPQAASSHGCYPMWGGRKVLERRDWSHPLMWLPPDLSCGWYSIKEVGKEREEGDTDANKRNRKKEWKSVGDRDERRCGQVGMSHALPRASWKPPHPVSKATTSQSASLLCQVNPPTTI